MLKESGREVLPMVKGAFCRKYLKRIADWAISVQATGI